MTPSKPTPTATTTSSSSSDRRDRLLFRLAMEHPPPPVPTVQHMTVYSPPVSSRIIRGILRNHHHEDSSASQKSSLSPFLLFSRAPARLIMSICSWLEDPGDSELFCRIRPVRQLHVFLVPLFVLFAFGQIGFRPVISSLVLTTGLSILPCRGQRKPSSPIGA